MVLADSKVEMVLADSKVARVVGRFQQANLVLSDTIVALVLCNSSAYTVSAYSIVDILCTVRDSL